jgi:hypothetical protein
VTRGATARRVTAAVVACLLLAACGGGAEAGPVDDRSRLVGALPDDALERGVDVIEPGGLDPLRVPASLLDPIIGELVAQAEVMVETAAPPLTLLAGIPAETALPLGARRIDDIVAIGRASDLAVVESRMGEQAPPRDGHVDLAGSDAPVAWSGPLPELHPDGQELGPGRALLEVFTDDVLITVHPTVRATIGAAVIAERLADGAPPGSPGKPWRTLLPAAEVTTDGPAVHVRAEAHALDGQLLRALLDGQSLTFLTR